MATTPTPPSHINIPTRHSPRTQEAQSCMPINERMRARGKNHTEWQTKSWLDRSTVQTIGKRNILYLHLLGETKHKGARKGGRPASLLFTISLGRLLLWLLLLLGIGLLFGPTTFTDQQRKKKITYLTIILWALTWDSFTFYNPRTEHDFEMKFTSIVFSHRVVEGSRSSWLQTLGNQLIDCSPHIRYTNHKYYLLYYIPWTC